MKSIFTIFIAIGLAISAHSQTRNVLVGTNGAVVSPTNFWSADASNARSGLGLGSAATNSSSAFQPSSTVLSNFSTSGVLAITNGGTGSTNASSARTALGATTVGDGLFTLANPSAVTFLRINANNTISALNAADFRTALGVGTGSGSVTSVALSAPSIFSVTGSPITNSGTLALALSSQSSRNIFAAPNGGGLPAFRAMEADDVPSLAISKITGLQTALDGKLSSSGTAALATNVTGIVALANGGTGATNASSARSNLGATTIGSSVFTLINPSAVRFLRLNADNTASALSDSDFRTAIGLGTAATNPSSAFQPSSSALTNLSSNNGANLTNLTAANITGTVALASNVTGTVALASNVTGTVALASNVTGIVALASNVTGTIAITNGGTGATNAGGARTNLGLGVTNDVTFNSLNFTNGGKIDSGGSFLTVYSVDSNVSFFVGTNLVQFYDPILFSSEANKSATRTNLGLPWSGLTNSNASTFQTALFGSGTNPVLANTSGDVVSPTNFWQVAPINTRVQYSQPVTNSTNVATNARNLYLYSLAISTVGITNTIALPTNAATFFGDVATVIHEGPTSSVTAIRQISSATNLITLNQFQEAVQFIYNGGGWKLADNISHVEPIYFSGTNASANAAASVTNLFTPNTPLVFNTNNQVVANTGTNTLTFTNGVIIQSGFNSISLTVGATAVSIFSGAAGENIITLPQDDVPVFSGNYYWNDPSIRASFGFSTNLNNFWISTSIGEARTNLGLPLLALTNTNNANFRTAIELGATNNVTFSNVTASGALTATGVVTTVTNLNVGGAINVTNKAETRTNIFGHGGLSTNIDIKLDNNNGMRLYFTNGILTNAVTPIP